MTCGQILAEGDGGAQRVIVMAQGHHLADAIARTHRRQGGVSWNHEHRIGGAAAELRAINDTLRRVYG